MKAIILAAGRGTRISKNISDMPKCTVDIGGVQLIRNTVEMLVSKGVTDISIITGYKYRFVMKACEGLPVKFFHNGFYYLSNSIGSLWFAKDLFNSEEDIIIANGDVFWSGEIFDLISSDSRPYVMLSDVLSVDSGDYFFKTSSNYIVNYGKELDRTERDTEYVGIAKIRADKALEFKAVLEKMIEECHADVWWENVLYTISSTEPVYALDVNGLFWKEVDFIEDYYKILEYRKEEKL